MRTDTIGQDNPAYEYALAHASCEPDIYFDDVDEGHAAATGDAMSMVRLLVVKMLTLSDGDANRLYTIMGTMAGLSLRDVSKLTGLCHESIRIHLGYINAADPVFYAALMRARKQRIDALIPDQAAGRWLITPPDGRAFYLYDLRAFCEERGWPYLKVWRAAARGTAYEGYIIKNTHDRRWRSDKKRRAIRTHKETANG